MTDSTENQTSSTNKQEQEKHYWIDDKNNIYKIFWGLVIVCGLLMFSDLFIEP